MLQSLYMNRTFFTKLITHQFASRVCSMTPPTFVVNVRYIKVHLSFCFSHVTASREQFLLTPSFYLLNHAPILLRWSTPQIPTVDMISQISALIPLEKLTHVLNHKSVQNHCIPSYRIYNSPSVPGR